MLFRWRAELGFARSHPANLAALRIAEEQHVGTHDAGPELVVLQDGQRHCVRVRSQADHSASHLEPCSGVLDVKRLQAHAMSP